MVGVTVIRHVHVMAASPAYRYPALPHHPPDIATVITSHFSAKVVLYREFKALVFGFFGSPHLSVANYTKLPEYVSVATQLIIDIEALSPSYLPDRLLHREDELSRVLANMKGSINMFIHGSCGSGKTSITKKTVSSRGKENCRDSKNNRGNKQNRP